MKEKIILITGPKHSGKSLAARALQKNIGWEALDLDELVEKETGETPRVLLKEGTENFQKAEEKVLASLVKQSRLIIAAGGGLVDNSEAMTLLSSHSEIIIVYLEVAAATAWQRILNSAAIEGELPPFLNSENPQETHLALHERRARAYKLLAHLTIAAENKSPKEIAGEIAKFLEH